MDVRCEKCMTVYEFDDSKVGEQGVTVKCTQCGNLFKVKRRERTAEIALSSVAPRSPAYVPPSGSAPNRVTKPGIPVLAKANTQTPAPMPTPIAAAHTPTPAPAPAPDKREEPAGWMIRLASSGEVFRFRELTTLQQWIVERKVTRDDEISRSGEQWKRLGGIAELASFFHVVEQAAAVARADNPRAAADAANAAYRRGAAETEDPALVTTAPMPMPERNSGPIAMGSGPVSMGGPTEMDDPAFARTNPQPKLTPSAVSVPHVDDDDYDDDLAPYRRRRGGLWAGLVALVVVLAAGGYLAMFQRDAVRGLFAHKDARADEGYRQGREYFLLDSDDAFRNATAAFERAHDADPKAALPLAGLAEVKATWAGYLRDDARALEANAGAGGPAPTEETAAKTLRREAQADLDDAKRAIDDALSLDPDAPEVNRAMAEFQLVDGAPAPEVERYLTRATAKRPADAESAYVAGALAYREGKLDEAKVKLHEANQLNQAATQHALLRASLLLARIDAQQGDKAAAKEALAPVLAANAQHDRARALMATLDGAAPALPAAVSRPPAVPAPSGKTVAAASSGVAASGVAQKADKDKGDEGAGEDYGKLVAQGDRLSENGHAKEARKLYERALAQKPDGLEAMTGLGYCDLDGERFSSAVDQFKRALAIRPGYGEAIIGLAEAYKLRGDRSEAVKWYKEYLDKQPGGPKAAMAKNNLRDLEPKTPDTTTEVKEEAPPTPAPPPTKAAAPADDDKKDDVKSDPKPDDKPAQLPRLPTNDEPPP